MGYRPRGLKESNATEPLSTAQLLNEGGGAVYGDAAEVPLETKYLKRFSGTCFYLSG